VERYAKIVRELEDSADPQKMQDLFTSTNDPLFFLHHAGLDRVWAIWQELSPSHLYDLSAPSNASATPPFRLGGPDISFNTPIWMGFAAPTRSVRDVIDTQNRDGKGFLCYKYEKDASEYLT
jgi:tyrosinase